MKIFKFSEFHIKYENNRNWIDIAGYKPKLPNQIHEASQLSVFSYVKVWGLAKWKLNGARIQNKVSWSFQTNSENKTTKSDLSVFDRISKERKYSDNCAMWQYKICIPNFNLQPILYFKT